MMSGTPHPATKEHGINQTIKDNGTPTTKVHGPTITKAKIQKARAKAVDEVGATATFPVTITAPTLMSIRIHPVLWITWIHLLNLNGLITRRNNGWTDMIWVWLFCITMMEKQQN